MSRLVRITHKLLPLAICCLLLAAHAKPLPDLKFRDLAGNPQRLSSLRGSVTVISFWATWCGPCREELPRLSAWKRAYADKGVRVLAISIDDPKDRATIEPYLAQQKIDLDVWVGADTDTLERLGLGDIVPGTLILDPDGTIVSRIKGEARDKDLTTRVDWLLSGRKGPAPEALLKRY